MVPASYKEMIKKHLDKVASKDAVFASKYDSSEKSIDECCSFIYEEAKKLANKENAICLADKVVFGWAVHFFDEKEPKEKEITEESPKKSKEDDLDARQLSLFDVPGYVSKF